MYLNSFSCRYTFTQPCISAYLVITDHHHWLLMWIMEVLLESGAFFVVLHLDTLFLSFYALTRTLCLQLTCSISASSSAILSCSSSWLQFRKVSNFTSPCMWFANNLYRIGELYPCLHLASVWASCPGW